MVSITQRIISQPFNQIQNMTAENIDSTPSTNDSEQSAKRNALKDVPTYMVFNQLCPDGIYRPVNVPPALVTSVQKLNPSVKIGDALAHTLILYKEPDTFAGHGAEIDLHVYEQFNEVVMAMGTALAACMCYASNFYFAGERFEKAGLKYFPELDQPSTANEAQPNQTT